MVSIVMRVGSLLRKFGTPRLDSNQHSSNYEFVALTVKLRAYFKIGGRSWDRTTLNADLETDCFPEAHPFKTKIIPFLAQI